ncbi:MAG: D-3-phosphoglycerate dehydrogenase / 2-oxoglutarate reductase [Candidatus Poribacteria bacterium]|nr:D-3-phosphoglycerate dehydrogenase / 2-oxoglutarate reductase [Candidatus Poribacteria bacterium]
MKILVTETLSDKGIEILENEDGITVDIETKLSQEELINRISDYDALIVRSATRVTSEVIEATSKMKVIGRAGVGVDNVDVRSATRKGIIVANTPNANTISAAEHTITLLLAMSRNISLASASLKTHKWERQKFLGVEVYNKILGIIGLGRIGTEVAKRAQAFGMHIIASDPYISPDTATKLNVRLVSNDELFQEADYITVHLPLTEETSYLIDERAFSLMKDGVRIINCARGGIFDEKALYNAIMSGKVAGAALDVFEQEPPLNSPLLELDVVLPTPHLGASTREALVNVSIEIAHQVVDALKGRPVSNAVNMITLDLGEVEKIRPFLKLAEKLGNVQGQLVEGHVTEINIDYKGELINYPTEIISIALQKGLLQLFLGDSVNYVNASIISHERGIKVSETKSIEIEDFVNLITVTVKTDKGERRVAGTIFGTKEPRIVEIDEYHLDVMPSGYLLILQTNKDRPGVMGLLGNMLGEYKINIAGMSMGREVPFSKAIAVLTLDNPVPKEVIERIKSLEGIWEAKLVRLD